MKALFLCLVPVVLPAFGQVPSIVPIALYTKFQREPPRAVFNALQDEVNSIMAPNGLPMAWRSLAAATGSQVSVELAVVTFKGRCDLIGLIRYHANPGPLGWTHLIDGAILPYADIDCEAVRGFIERELLTVPIPNREEAYGRAIGRVLAHELYHIFANTTRHGSHGIGKSEYTVQELLSTDFQFDARESQALKSSKAHAAVETARRLSGVIALSARTF